MSEIVVGKLKEMLVLETDIDNLSAIVVYPKGTVVEVSSEDTYPSYSKDEDFTNAAQYLKKIQDDEDRIDSYTIADIDSEINDHMKHISILLAELIIRKATLGADVDIPRTSYSIKSGDIDISAKILRLPNPESPIDN
jgi:hypothetical protein